MSKHAHCGYCGHRFAAEQPWPRRCAGCGNTSYVNPTPVAVCLLPVGDGLLCVRRAIPPGAGQFALPGGYIDRAESWQQAAARELFEETGLRIDAAEVEHFRTLSSDRGDGILLVFGLARPRGPEVLAGFVPTTETSELVVIREATELAFPLHTRAVAEYFAQPPRELVERLSAHGQQHLTFGWQRLPPAERENLVKQFAQIDFANLRALHAARDAATSALPARETISPIPVLPSAVPAAVRRAGEVALRRGEVAVLLVAGGQGSRLGFEKPKGMYPVGPVSNASLFQIHAEKVLAVSRRYGRPVPLLVMTSPATHAETEAYFREHDFFGLPERDVRFFQQGTMPAVDIATGRLLLEAPGRLFLGPNGHGGTLTALADTGLLAELESRGVRHVFYFQVDNPLVKVCDPAFLGHHVAARSEVSSKVVFKERPEEKVGVLASVGGRCAIIEYSDMPPAMTAERDDSGVLRFRAGNPAIHIFDVGFLRRVTGGGLAWHVARKKVPHLDTETGQVVNPTTENALKFELFIFDALPMAERWLAMETSRAEEFAPLKNATGADSPATVFDAMTRLHASWLEAVGVPVPRSPDGGPVHAIEVSPLFALDAEECRAKVSSGMEIAGSIYLR